VGGGGHKALQCVGPVGVGVVGYRQGGGEGCGGVAQQGRWGRGVMGKVLSMPTTNQVCPD